MDVFRLVQIVKFLHDEVPAHGSGTFRSCKLAFLGFPLQVAKNCAGWSSLAARRAHNPKVTGSNPVPATIKGKGFHSEALFFFS